MWLICLRVLETVQLKAYTTSGAHRGGCGHLANAHHWSKLCMRSPTYMDATINGTCISQRWAPAKLKILKWKDTGQFGYTTDLAEWHHTLQS
jgi:hypothetical protein